MRYAQIVLDIPTRQLEGAFTYAIPDELASQVQVGATVLVTFSLVKSQLSLKRVVVLIRNSRF